MEHYIKGYHTIRNQYHKQWSTINSLPFVPKRKKSPLGNLKNSHYSRLRRSNHHVMETWQCTELFNANTIIRTYVTSHADPLMMHELLKSTTDIFTQS